MALELEPLHSGETFSFVDKLLDQQQDTSAVERFAQQHETADKPLLASYYQDLIPLSAPQSGEQYAFEVDLDACSGCKSCVTACHNLNGLTEDEQWRRVGMLHGESNGASVLQHVTTACHHCVEPACLEGCPVMAYEKDSATGIVRHLDDQCIGCQYCVFMCPYDVPQYLPSKGIVRKCDMCHDRLAAGEAPACVQSCPNGAIRIRSVPVEQVAEACETKQFLPAAPDPRITRPTTIYKSRKPLSEDLLPADYYSANKQHAHMPLVFMLVLTQLSVGAYVVDHALVSGPWSDATMLTSIRPVYAVAGLGIALFGMLAALLHLGRPAYAFRAVLGLRTSWLSREILAFVVFSLCAFVYAVAVWFTAEWEYLIPWVDGVGLATAVTGLVAVFCSVMIYVKTRRPYWSIHQTGTKFFLTCLVLGLPSALLVSLISCSWSENLAMHSIMHQYGQLLCRWLIASVVVKLALESSVFLWLLNRQPSSMKHSALLLSGELSMTFLLRCFFAVMGGVFLPLVLLFDKATLADESGFDPLFTGFFVVLITLLLLIGELLERYTFFAASVAPRMPGGPCP